MRRTRRGYAARARPAVEQLKELLERAVGPDGVPGGVEVHQQAADHRQRQRRAVLAPDAAQAVGERAEPIRRRDPAELRPQRLLAHLLRNAGRMLSKTQLAYQLWDAARDDNTIERLVSRLRHKVDSAAPPLIPTRRGFGYWLGALQPTTV